MDTNCLDHVLTPTERQFFESNGYLIIENALDPVTNQRLIDVLDRVDARERTDDLASKLLSVTNIVSEDQSLIDLVDLPTVFPKIWGILGWNVYLYHSHLDITPDALRYRKGSPHTVIPLCRELGFDSVVDDIPLRYDQPGLFD